MRRLITLLLTLFALPAFAQLPAVPGGVAATATGSTTTRVTWGNAADALSYVIFRNGVQVGASNTLTYNDTGLTPGTQYSYTVAGVNLAGTSAQSQPATVTTLTVPSPPTGLRGTSPTATTVVLNWNAVTGATEYTIYRDGDEVGTTTTPTFTDTGLRAGTRYEYTVDVTTAGGTSDDSAVVTVTTSSEGSAKQQAWARAFRKDDADMDGAVSWGEYYSAKGGRLAWVIVRNRFLNSDKDLDGELTLEEYANALGGRRFFAPSRLGQFLLADLDEDGLLDPDEFALTLSPRVKEAVVLRRYGKLDKDDEEGISQLEFGIRRPLGAF